jgi:hypothetical protein
VGRETTKPIKRLGGCAAALLTLLLCAPPAEANVIRGIGQILSGVLAVPLTTLVGTFSGPPLVGTAMGAINGTFQGVRLVASGALELVSSGVAVAKTVAPYLLPFLL